MEERFEIWLVISYLLKEIYNIYFHHDHIIFINSNSGEGVGKTNQGMINPIKAKFKFDNTGVKSSCLYKLV